MTVREVGKLLEKSGHERPASSPKREGFGRAPYEGGISKRLAEIARTIQSDPVLADELYAVGGYDMKLLATLIDDPESYTQDELEKRAHQVVEAGLGRSFGEHVIVKSIHAVHFISEWMESDDPAFRSVAYHSLAKLTRAHNRLSDGFFRAHLSHILRNINREVPEVQSAMVSSAQAICKRCPGIKRTCKEVAKTVEDLAQRFG